MILTGDRFYPNAENLVSILILQFVLFMHVFHLLYFVSNDNNKDVQSIVPGDLSSLAIIWGDTGLVLPHISGTRGVQIWLLQACLSSISKYWALL